MSKVYKYNFTKSYAIEVSAAGYEIDLCVCEFCGAVILLGGNFDFDPLERHCEWHDTLSKLAAPRSCE